MTPTPPLFTWVDYPTGIICIETSNIFHTITDNQRKLEAKKKTLKYQQVAYQKRPYKKKEL